MLWIENYPFDALIDYNLIFQALCSFCYLISCFFILSNPYGGSNAFLLGIVFAGNIALSYQGIRRAISRTYFGVVLACTIFLILIALQNAIYWGEYSDCSEARRLDGVGRALSIGYYCQNRHAMKSVCAFSVLMFLSYIFQVALLIRYKDEILGNGPLNEGYTVDFSDNNSKSTYDKLDYCSFVSMINLFLYALF